MIIPGGNMEGSLVFYALYGCINVKGLNLNKRRPFCDYGDNDDNDDEDDEDDEDDDFKCWLNTNEENGGIIIITHMPWRTLRAIESFSIIIHCRFRFTVTPNSLLHKQIHQQWINGIMPVFISLARTNLLVYATRIEWQTKIDESLTEWANNEWMRSRK